METEKKQTYQLAHDIELAYRDKKPAEEILAMYAALEDKEAIDPNNSDRTYLHLAAEHSDAKAIEYLLEQGVRANIKARYGITLLHTLARGSHYESKVDNKKVKEAADVILKARVSPLLRDEDAGDICYHTAAKNENLPFIYAMIDNKVKLDMADKEGSGLLHILVRYPARYAQEGLKYNKTDEQRAEIHDRLDRCFDLIKALIEYGLDPEAKDQRQGTPIDYAVEYNLGRITILLKGEYDESDSSLEDKVVSKGKTLHQAAKDDMEALEALIRLGADVNEVCAEGQYKNLTPLGVACQHLNIDGVKALLAAGADPNVHDGEKETSAMYYLIEYGGSYSNVKDKEKVALMVIKCLIDAGVDINGFVDSKKNTALNLACLSAYRDMKDIYRAELLESGLCDLNLADKDGVTPLMNLCFNANSENDIIAMLEQGVDMSLRNARGDTALMYLARSRNVGVSCSVADLMFSFGDPMPAVTNNDGKTAVDIAIEENNENLVKFLLGKM